MDFLELFNALLKHNSLGVRGGSAATSYEQVPFDIGLDSLDMVLVMVTFAEAFGLPEGATVDKISTTTLGDLRDFVLKHKTKEPESLEQFLEAA
jgi:hypothetical protein